MKKYTIVLLIICLLLMLTSCSTTSFKVKMHENYTAEEVTMKVTIDGTTYSDLIFEINGREYRVSPDDGSPTVNEPYFVLYSEDDGMDYVTLHLISDTATDMALLSMLPEDGVERVYTCPLDEMKPLTDWMASN